MVELKLIEIIPGQDEGSDRVGRAKLVELVAHGAPFTGVVDWFCEDIGLDAAADPKAESEAVEYPVLVRLALTTVPEVSDATVVGKVVPLIVLEDDKAPVEVADPGGVVEGAEPDPLPEEGPGISDEAPSVGSITTLPFVPVEYAEPPSRVPVELAGG